MSHSVETYENAVVTGVKKSLSSICLHEETDARSNFSTSDYVRAALNQIKFGWNVHIWPSFDPDAQIYFMGRCYSAENDASSSVTTPARAQSVDGNLSDFADDFATRLWFTYREDFSPLCVDGKNRLAVAPSHSNSSITYSDQPAPVGLTSEDFLSYDVDVLDDIPSCEDEHALHSNKTRKHWNAKFLHRLVPKVASTFRKHRSAHQQSDSNMKLDRPIPLSIQTSDSGWGCMIRSGQMLLAQAIMIHLLGRNWRVFKQNKSLQTPEDHLYRQIIRWFHDSWDQRSPFSLHHLVQASGQSPGSWFGPATMCSILVKTMHDASRRFNALSRLHVYWARDRVIYREEIMDLIRGYPVRRKDNRLNYTEHSGTVQDRECSAFLTSMANSTSDSTVGQSNISHAVILLLPLMLGPRKRVERRYIPVICRLIQDPCFLGIIGGRPKHSVCMLGCQNTQLIHLDPHFTQPVVRNLLESDSFSTKTFHCVVPRVIEASKLDPSCTIGFYCPCRGDLSDLLERLPDLMAVNPDENNGSRTIETLIEIKNDDA